jgi:hypothetical protein
MTKQSTKRKPPTKRLRDRALAIIKSDAYDDGTRESIRFMLRTSDLDLADMVKRAEEGETICDTLMVQAKRRQGVRQVVKLLASAKSVVPLWFLEAIESALVTVAKEVADIDQLSIINHSQAGNWLGVNQGADRLIADLFTVSAGRLDRDFTFTPVLTERQRVVEATAEILRNPQTPADLFEHVAEFVNGVLNSTHGSDQIHHQPRVLAVILDSFPEDELMGAHLAAERARREALKGGTE